jgi:hypothetical protein
MLRGIERQLVTDVAGQPFGPNFKGQTVQDEWTALPLKMGSTGCPKISVTNYQSALGHKAED